MINYAAIGQRVKEYRIKACLTQSELAEALDVSTGYISQIECGHTQVSLNRLDSIASIIDTKISEIANEQSKQQFEYYNNLVNKEQSLREFRHDYKNQLIVLEAYLKKEDIESARNYIVKSFDLLNETSGIQTGNYILDVLITEKQQKAGSISVEFKGKMTSKFVEPIDICTIFGNALDNAIEACQKIDVSDQRIIRISIQESINTLHISISNPVKSKVNMVNNNILTTKEDNTNHGLGLFSIKKVAKKYKGKVAITCDDDVFSLSILLINSKKF